MCTDKLLVSCACTHQQFGESDVISVLAIHLLKPRYMYALHKECGYITGSKHAKDILHDKTTFTT